MKRAPWEILEEKAVYKSGIFSLKELRCRHRERPMDFTFKVLECTDWVNIVPITREKEVVLVRQYRLGTREFTLELPGGAVDGKDGGAAEAARRELLEETGYSAPRFVRLGSASSNPALFSNRVHTYLADPANLIQAQQPDPGEDIEVELVPSAKIPGLIRDGTIHHALVVAAFYHYFLSTGFVDKD